MSSKIFGLVLDWQASFTHVSTYLGGSRPAKGLFAINGKVSKISKSKQSFKLANCCCSIPSEEVPIVNKTEDTDGRVLDMDEPVHNVIQNKHAKAAKGTTFGQSSARDKPITVGVPDLEPSCHGCQGPCPCTQDIVGGTHMQGCCKDRPPWKAVETFLDVSCQAAQHLVLIISNLYVMNQRTPEMGSAVSTSVPIYVRVGPLVTPPQEHSGLDATIHSVQQWKDGYWSELIGGSRPFLFG